MANRAYLYVGTNDGPPAERDEQVLRANYLVPVPIGMSEPGRT